MGLLKKPYELSLWADVYDQSSGKFAEERICIIGSSTSTAQGRAIDVKLTGNINGTISLSFSMYYQYKDNITGELVTNPICSYLTNERKLKLHYDDEWYDFVIKSVKKDSSKYLVDVLASDLYVNELSKNGYNVELDAELNNNIGTINQLAEQVLADTDWTVVDVGNNGSDFLVDTNIEPLIEAVTTTDIAATHLKQNGTGQAPTEESASIPNNTRVYLFYSCCQNEDGRLALLYIPDDQTIEKDDDRVILNKNCEYYIDHAAYGGKWANYDVSIPAGFSLAQISQDYRGKRTVYSNNIHYNSKLGKYVTDYTKDGDAYYGYSESEVIVSKLLNDYIKGVDFKSTAGWKTGFKEEAPGKKVGTIECTNYPFAVPGTVTAPSNSMLKSMIKGDYDSETTYVSYLHYHDDLNTKGILMSTGIYDNRSTLIAAEDFINGTNFTLFIKYRSTVAWQVKAAAVEYNAETQVYTVKDEDVYLDFGTLAASSTFPEQGKETKITASVKNMDLTAAQLRSTKIYLLFYPTSIDSTNGTTLDIESCSLYRTLGDQTPYEQTIEAITTTTYYYYLASAVNDATNINDVLPVAKSVNAPSADFVATPSCEKRRSISAKQSNYFNIIQDLCEKFECWVKFHLARNSSGTVTSKSISFHRYIGNDNYAGFRYGVNLKSISRTDDSKAIVTKLIVSDNSNEFGENGYCSIARAPSNETGESVIYNFDYYLHTQALSAGEVWDSLYNTNGATGADVSVAGVTNSNGYYVRLRSLNTKLQDIAATLSKQSLVVATYESDITMYQAGLASAEDERDDAIEEFRAAANWPYTDLWTDTDNKAKHEEWLNTSNHKKYLTAITTTLQAVSNYSIKLAAAKTAYQGIYSSYTQQQNEYNKLVEQKTALNKAFYSRYSRFIQEGTWISEDYYDDEQYYLDALSTLYNSAVPRVSYNISVLELSQLDEYSDFIFALGDQTFVEDPEFFGYDETTGAPLREKVTLTEITYNLDAPDKNTIKIQNYSSQFQDLFKKITATVQSVQYSTGSYEKAAELAEATAEKKGQFLQEAFNNAGMVIKNASEQSVVLDGNGLTITDKLEPNKALRAVCGGIALTTDGGDTWTLGLTAAGVSAKLITSGILNTGEVNIMSGTDASFRWDSLGLTAYDFTASDGVITSVNTQSGVRFDHFGIYGYTGIDGSSWVPNSIAQWHLDDTTAQLVVDTQSIRAHSTFELTKEGMYLNLSEMIQGHYIDEKGVYHSLGANAIHHQGGAALGKVSDLIYNTWGVNGPYYDAGSTASTFVKVLSVQTSVGNNGDIKEQLAIYDDGTLMVENIKLAGTIEWTSTSSPIKSVYGRKAYSKPDDGTRYNTFENESSTAWHKNYSEDDQYYCRTENGGATWVGPMRLNPQDGSDGESGYTIKVYSDKSTILQNKADDYTETITLTVQILYGDTDITDDIGNSASAKYGSWSFAWQKADKDVLNSSYQTIVGANSKQFMVKYVVSEGRQSYRCVINTQ